MPPLTANDIFYYDASYIVDHRDSDRRNRETDLNELPTELREPRQILSPSRSPPITHRSSSSPSSLSPLSSSLTRSVFHSERLGSLANPFHHRPFPHLLD